MSVFSDLKPRNSAPRNGFDLSRYATFSSKVGPIKSVFNQLTEPSSEYSINIRQLLRTQPLQTAAFAGFSINYDVVWTPLNYLYSSFNQFVAQQVSKSSTTQPDFQDTGLPRIPLSDFLRFLLPLAAYDYTVSFYKGDLIQSGNSSLYGMHRYVFVSQSTPDTSLCLDIISQLDELGYGNYLPVVKMLSKLIIDDSGIDIDSTSNWLESLQRDYFSFSESKPVLFVNIFNHDVLMRNVDSIFRKLSSSENNVQVSLWPALAYNKVFYEFYRNSYYDSKFSIIFDRWDRSDTFDYDYVELFNLDDFTPIISFSNVSNRLLFRYFAIFAKKNHQYKKDLFTGVLPSSQFGEAAVASDIGLWHRLMAGRSSEKSEYGYNPPTRQVQVGVTSNGSSLGTISNLSGDISSTSFNFDPGIMISALELRKADAMQRFKERMMRAGDKVSDIFVAHGWSQPKSEQSTMPIFVGSFDGRLDINTVAATTDSGSFDVGQLAANGVSVITGHQLKIKTSDFGILQVFFYITKDAIYNSFGVDKQHYLLEPFDFPYPELQNVSLRPITRGQLTNYNYFANDNFNTILGYLPADMHFKTAVDKVYGEFASVVNLKPDNGVIDVLQYSNVPGVFSNWVTPRNDDFNCKEVSFLYVQPDCADNIFAVNANSRPDTDQFLVNTYFECYAVQPNTVIGLPI